MLYGGLRLRDMESIQVNTNSQVLWERRACVNSGSQNPRPFLFLKREVRV